MNIKTKQHPGRNKLDVAAAAAAAVAETHN